MPTVYVGAPPHVDEYQKHRLEGIDVYVSNSVDVSRGLKIRASGFAMFKGLTVVPLR